MKIAICGSVSFPEKIFEAQKDLLDRGHEAVIPYSLERYEIKGFDHAEGLKKDKEFVRDVKPGLTMRHFNEIKNSDAILVVNVEKNGVPNYIGGATFAEMMIAFYFGKRIFLLNPIPDHEKMDFLRDEIECTNPVVLNGNLDMVK